jgi:protein-S-isoprenylcysteine O-methyltransferase Ste14
VPPGKFLFRRRNLVFPVAFLGVALVDRPRYPFESAAADAALDALGLGVAAAGQGLRALVIGLAYIRRGGRDGQVHADALVQEGVFAHCRNPLYLGNILVFLGLATVLNSWAGWLLGVPAVLFAYMAIVAAEEEFLHRRFGAEYEDYCRRVRRFWPSGRGLRQTLAGFAFDWRRVVKKEYGSTFAWAAAALAVLGWERIANGRGEEVRDRWPLWAATWGLLFAGWGVARFLKKTRRLDTPRDAAEEAGRR